LLLEEKDKLLEEIKYLTKKAEDLNNDKFEITQ